MSTSNERDADLRDALVEMVEGAEPAGDWQAGVWSKLARDPQERRLRRRVFAWRLAACGLAVVCTVVVVLWRVNVAEHKADMGRAEQRFKQLGDQMAIYQSEIDELLKAKSAELTRVLAAKTEEALHAAQARAAELDRQLVAKRKQLVSLREASKKRAARARERRKRVKVKCDSTDPLCGL